MKFQLRVNGFDSGVKILRLLDLPTSALSHKGGCWTIVEVSKWKGNPKSCVAFLQEKIPGIRVFTIGDKAPRNYKAEVKELTKRLLVAELDNISYQQDLHCIATWPDGGNNYGLLCR